MSFAAVVHETMWLTSERRKLLREAAADYGDLPPERCLAPLIAYAIDLQSWSDEIVGALVASELPPLQIGCGEERGG